MSRLARTLAVLASRYWAITWGVIDSIGAFSKALLSCLSSLRLRELGNDQYLSQYDAGTLAARLGNTPQADGDGQRYRGWGLIQVTGRANYEACSEALFGDSRLLNTPELLENPVYAALSAGWFWQKAVLNTLADKGDFLTITKRINGGTNGLANRQALYERALKVLA
ncbi:glycoside hydrolase family 19 protein [Pseudomonas sp. MSSRFD41]|nr:glycoside hydrolase family 19 protein [Pseudomonas sp. MSSRFD41]